MSLFDDQFRGAALQLRETFADCGRVIIQPTEGDPITVDAILHDEDKGQQNNGPERKVGHELALTIVAGCPDEVARGLATIKTRYRVIIGDVSYRIANVITRGGMIDLLLEHGETGQIAGPSTFRK